MMFFRWTADKRSAEVDEAMASHEKAVRRFKSTLAQVEAARAQEVHKMLLGLVPVHKGNKNDVGE